MLGPPVGIGDGTRRMLTRDRGSRDGAYGRGSHVARPDPATTPRRARPPRRDLRRARPGGVPTAVGGRKRGDIVTVAMEAGRQAYRDVVGKDSAPPEPIAQ